MKINRLKIIMQTFVKYLFKFLPNKIIRSLILSFPRLAVCSPPNFIFSINDYLGIYTININTSSCVERYMLRGTYEPSNLKIIENYVNDGDICFDIGANVGAISLALAKAVGTLGKVYSFEPHPNFYEKLCNHIKINNLIQNVSTINRGVSSAVGTLFLEEDIRVEGRGNAGIVATETKNSFIIDVITLDNFVLDNDLQKVDFIKIDVEGHEKEVIIGCFEILKKFKPKILFETIEIFNNDLNQNKFKEIEILLKSINYILFGVDYNGSIKKIESIGEYPMTFALPYVEDNADNI